MGDRGNIEIKSEAGSVFLYTHWRGSELPAIVKKALKQQRRWDDPSYLARIVFDVLKGDDIASETGFGIYPKKAEGPVITIDTENQIVNLNGRKKYSFAEYCS